MSSKTSPSVCVYKNTFAPEGLIFCCVETHWLVDWWSALKSGALHRVIARATGPERSGRAQPLGPRRLESLYAAQPQMCERFSASGDWHNFAAAEHTRRHIIIYGVSVCDREMRERLDIRGSDMCFRIFRKQEAGIRLYNARRSNSFTAHAMDINTVALRWN